ncbi:hypothetical protein ACFQ88_27685 [Paenibacillus sp. NPDC056579]|uniref:hypothetical protein n=1 Tax=Paenibacillus sp. NPDC056579 TaxID=3345871 RepID=UPI0036CC565D
MRWTFFYIVTVSVLVIAWVEWPQLKKKPKRDRVVFVSLLLLGWGLSMLDLPNTPGPPMVLEAIFKPLWPLLEP